MGKGLLYQLKSCFRDKMCVLSFLLPVAAGIALHFLGEVDLLELAEPEFGVVKESLFAADIQSWLEEIGTVRVYPSEEALEEAVLEPSTNIIGILPREDGISVIRAGDEQELYRRLADRLPLLYEERAAIKTVQVTLDVREADTGMKKLLLSISIVTAMFMGGTFSAMNILGEKEDGILLVNDILPCSRLAYLFQKIGVGLLGGVLSAGLTTVICIWPVRLSRLPGLAAVIFVCVSGLPCRCIYRESRGGPDDGNRSFKAGDDRFYRSAHFVLAVGCSRRRKDRADLPYPFGPCLSGNHGTP